MHVVSFLGMINCDYDVFGCRFGFTLCQYLCGIEVVSTIGVEIGVCTAIDVSVCATVDLAIDLVFSYFSRSSAFRPRR